jgi:hypothetical protein
MSCANEAPPVRNRSCRPSKRATVCDRADPHGPFSSLGSIRPTGSRRQATSISSKLAPNYAWLLAGSEAIASSRVPPLPERCGRWSHRAVPELSRRPRSQLSRAIGPKSVGKNDAWFVRHGMLLVGLLVVVTAYISFFAVFAAPQSEPGLARSG